ncbi:MAG: toxic anion resistance protein, partial [Erythrobacter sp.]
MSTQENPGTNIATATKAATDFELTPPDPVPQVAPEKAAGLVPVSSEQKSKLDQKVESFVADLVSADANSPEFGEKVDQITRMGQEQIRAAAGHSNRFLDRPVRAMDEDSSVGKDLAE